MKASIIILLVFILGLTSAQSSGYKYVVFEGYGISQYFLDRNCQLPQGGTPYAYIIIDDSTALYNTYSDQNCQNVQTSEKVFTGSQPGASWVTVSFEKEFTFVATNVYVKAIYADGFNCKGDVGYGLIQPTGVCLPTNIYDQNGTYQKVTCNNPELNFFVSTFNNDQCLTATSTNEYYEAINCYDGSAGYYTQCY